MLIKKNDKKREAVYRQALQKLLDTTQHTDYITEVNWQNVVIKDSIRKSLHDFVDFVRDNRIVSWLGKSDEFGYIQSFCNDIHDLDIKSLQEYLNTIKNDLIKRIKTVDYENEDFNR